MMGLYVNVLHPHVSWPGHFYWDSLPTKPPTLLLSNASWRALLYHQMHLWKSWKHKIFSIFLSASVFPTRPEVMTLNCGPLKDKDKHKR